MLKNAEAAQTVRSRYQSYQESKNRKLRAAGNLSEAEKNRANAQKKVESAELRQQLHRENSAADQENRQRLLRLENAREIYRTLAEKQKTLQLIRREAAGAEKNLAAAENQFLRKRKGWYISQDLWH